MLDELKEEKAEDEKNEAILRSPQKQWGVIKDELAAISGKFGEKLGMAIRRGEELPDISTSIGLRQALVKADSIAYSASSSGIFVSEVLFPRLGIVDVVGPKSRRIDNERVGAVVARGEAEIGFQQMSELVPLGDLLVVGKLPDELQQTKIISAGICAGAANRSAAQLVCHHLSQPLAAERMAKGGLDPL